MLQHQKHSTIHVNSSPHFITATANRIIERVRALGEGVVDRCGCSCRDVPRDSLDTQPVICVWCYSQYRISRDRAIQFQAKLGTASSEVKILRLHFKAAARMKWLSTEGSSQMSARYSNIPASLATVVLHKKHLSPRFASCFLLLFPCFK